MKEHHYHGEGWQERNRIGQEARRHSHCGQQCPAHGGPEDPRGVDHYLVEADRVGGAVLADEVEHEDLARWGVERVDQADREREHVYDPDPEPPERDKRAERGAQYAEGGLRPKKDLAALETVDERAGPRPSEQRRGKGCRGGEREQDRAPGELQDQP